MARSLNKLSDVAVKAAGEPGRYSDGGGLYLAIGPTGRKSWTFVWTREGRKREMGLGAYPAVSLGKARQRAGECRTLIADGRDPIAERKKETEPSFGECAKQYIASMEGAWRSAKHRVQWRTTFDTYCGPVLQKRVSQIDTADVLGILKPIWLSKAETASRLRGRIERVLSYARARGWRSGENPALWRGHLDALLPRRQKLQHGHHKAMSYKEVPDFVQRLSVIGALSATALKFIILTAVRRGEALGARWDEIDLANALWTIPAGRMKAARAHAVPLSTPTLALIMKLYELRQSPFVFPGERDERPLTASAIQRLTKRLRFGYTVHGFRSAFRDWAGDRTHFPREVAEAALAHRVGDETERAYRRSDALEKRRNLMQAWGDYCSNANLKRSAT